MIYDIVRSGLGRAIINLKLKHNFATPVAKFGLQPARTKRTLLFENASAMRKDGFQEPNSM